MKFSFEEKGDFSKSKHESKDDDGRESPFKERPKSIGKGRNPNEESSKAKKSLKCILCNGTHLAKDYLVRQHLATMLTMKEKDQWEAAWMSSLRIIIFMKSQAAPKKKGFIYVEISIMEHKLNALIDTKAFDVFIFEKATNIFGLKLKKSNGKLKIVNSNKIPMAGMDWGINLHIGD